MEHSSQSTRELTLEEAVSIAILLQKNEQLAEAEKLYRAIFEIAPDHPDALHYAGVLAHQQGRSDEAVALIEKSLALVPDRADCYSNLGIVFQAQGKLDDAIAAYRRAISLNPNHANAHSNLGVLLRATGKPVEAEARVSNCHSPGPRSHRCVHQPGHPSDGVEAKRGSGRVLLQGDYAKAEAPGSPTTAGAGALHDRRDRRGGEDLRGMARRGAGRPDCAAHAGGLHRPGRSAARVGRVRRRNLRHLRRELRVEAREAVLPRSGARRGDAGRFRTRSRRRASMCSMPAAERGYAVRCVVPYARRLSGVDLSAGMLAQAKEKNVYDELVQGELTEYLRDSQGGVRPDCLGRHAGLFRRPGGRHRGRRGSAATARPADLYS